MNSLSRKCKQCLFNMNKKTSDIAAGGTSSDDEYDNDDDEDEDDPQDACYRLARGRCCPYG